MNEFILPFFEVHAVDHCNNNCRWCNNHSPFSPKREYDVREYVPWIDRLEERGVKFRDISVMGGEPFLHSDLSRFVYGLKRRYNRVMAVTTNIFWLSEQAIKRYEGVFHHLNLVFISYYPNIIRELGGPERVADLIERLGETYPHVQVEVRDRPVFTRIEYPEQPVAVTARCGAADCTCLLPDGRLGRCGPGAYHHFNPRLPDRFRNSRDMFWDIEADERDIRSWRSKYPLDACSHCTAFRAERTVWKVEKGMRRHKEYEVEAHLGTARSLFTMGMPDQAERALLDILDRYPGDPEILNDLGVIAHAMGNADLALQRLERALEIDPKYADARANYRALRSSI